MNQRITRLGKMTSREAHASWHNGDQLRAPLNPRYNTAVVIMRFQVGLNWIPMMPREASLSDSCTPDRYSFFSSLAV